jgi:hypothetical protein
MIWNHQKNGRPRAVGVAMSYSVTQRFSANGMMRSRARMALFRFNSAVQAYDGTLYNAGWAKRYIRKCSAIVELGYKSEPQFELSLSGPGGI